MTDEVKLKQIYQTFEKWFDNNKNPTKDDMRNWLKYAYVMGKK